MTTAKGSGFLIFIKKNDFNTSRKFSIDGIRLNWYASNTFELFIYSKYFWYLEISKATKVLGAYMGIIWLVYYWQT
jgi:hypothetical protein